MPDYLVAAYAPDAVDRCGRLIRDGWSGRLRRWRPGRLRRMALGQILV